jgi:hypothetical protein
MMALPPNLYFKQNILSSSQPKIIVSRFFTFVFWLATVLLSILNMSSPSGTYMFTTLLPEMSSPTLGKPSQ